ncbi:hypothetical protein GWL_27730 [Herbaspirillum sp. GW103]|nr:hypothetical protein GWL_27730 [Herbaspirillum sp. GW103]
MQRNLASRLAAVASARSAAKPRGFPQYQTDRGGGSLSCSKSSCVQLRTSGDKRSSSGPGKTMFAVITGFGRPAAKPVRKRLCAGQHGAVGL